MPLFRSLVVVVKIRGQRNEALHLIRAFLILRVHSFLFSSSSVFFFLNFCFRFLQTVLLKSNNNLLTLGNAISPSQLTNFRGMICLKFTEMTISFNTFITWIVFMTDRNTWWTDKRLWKIGKSPNISWNFIGNWLLFEANETSELKLTLIFVIVEDL